MILLHLGAHKTATTWLQAVLAANQGLIARHGRAYWPLEIVRPRLAEPLRAMERAQGRGARLRDLLRRLRGRDDRFAPLRELIDAAGEVILSDENLIGDASDGLGGQLYPLAPARLGTIAQLLAGQEVTVLLAIRDYPDFLSSMFAESLRHGHHQSVASLVAANGAPEGQWPALVAAIRAALPASPLIVWRFEDFARLEDEVLARIAGVPAAALDRAVGGPQRVSPSGEAVRAYLETMAPRTRMERVLAMAALESAHPPAGPASRFDPWPADQRARMSAAYGRDVARLKAMDGVTVL